MRIKDKTIFIYAIGVLTLIIAIVGTTVAFFTATASSGDKISGSAAVMGLNLSVVPKSDGMNNPLIPQKTDAISNAVKGTTNGTCVDANGNTVCQVYEITVENTGNTPVVLNGTITFVAETIQDLKWGLGTSATEGFSATKTYSKNETDLIGPGVPELQDITLKENDNVVGNGKDTAKFYIVVYIEETNANQSTTNTGDFTGTVKFDAVGGNGVSATFVS